MGEPHFSYITEDVSKDKKKKVDGGKKGKRVERDLCKKLTERFKMEFSRSIGSGNRWGQVANMPKHATETFSGDICCPENFKWVLESKGGYEDIIELGNVFGKGSKKLDEFLSQADDESKRCGRKPLLAWKRSHQPWLAFVHTKELGRKKFEQRLIYKEWSCITLDELLKFGDEFFFDEMH